MLTIPVWMPVVLKTIGGSCLGTVAGFVTGIVAFYLLMANATSARSCSESIALGAVVLGLLTIGSAVGFVVGTLTALIFSVRHARKSLSVQ